MYNFMVHTCNLSISTLYPLFCFILLHGISEKDIVMLFLHYIFICQLKLLEDFLYFFKDYFWLFS